MFIPPRVRATYLQSHCCMWPFKRNKSVPDTELTLEKALEELARLGVALSAGVSLDDVLLHLNQDITEPLDKVGLLCALGEEAEELDAEWLSRDIWHFDAECIDDHGCYTRLAHRFSVLAGPSLPLLNIADHVDLEHNVARLEFDLDGNRIHWDLEVDNDWMDPGLYTRFQSLLATRSSRRFMICALGQDSLVLCGDEEKRRAISQFLGLEFQWE